MSATGEAERGFTLLEMLTVLALTTLISLIAFPMMKQAMASVTLEQSRQAVMSDLLRARARALSQGVAVRLSLDPDGGGYGWTGGPNRRLAAGARLSAASGGSIGFFPDGSAKPARLTLTVGGRQASFNLGQTGAVFATTEAAAAPTEAAGGLQPVTAAP